MSKFSVSLVFSADSGLDVEADSPEEAAEIAYNSNEANPSLCHECAGEVNLGDCIRVIVHDENDKEVFDDGFEVAELAKLTKQRDELLAALEKGGHSLREISLWDKTTAKDVAMAKAAYAEVKAAIASVKGGAA